MRILIAGDTHGSLPWALFLLDKATEFEADRIFVLGDFGYWPRWGDGRDFLFKLDHQLRKADVPLMWLDGNHEDHKALNEIVKGTRELVKISDWITYAPRGCLVQWDDLRCVTLGGAFSIDRSMRVLGKSWFEQEVISDEDVEHAISHGTADILLSHDSPLSIPLASHHLNIHDEVEIPCFENRSRVEKAAGLLEVSRIYHGHQHYAHRTPVKIRDRWVQVEGLANDHQMGAWTILDTLDSLKLNM